MTPRNVLPGYQGISAILSKPGMVSRPHVLIGKRTPQRGHVLEEMVRIGGCRKSHGDEGIRDDPLQEESRPGLNVELLREVRQWPALNNCVEASLFEGLMLTAVP